MVTRNGNGPFDLDYNLVLSSIPQEYTGSLEKLKALIRSILNDLIPANFSHGKDSTSAITYILHSPDMKRVEFKMDVALVLAGKNCYNKLVHDKKTRRYIWNKIRKSADLEPKLDAIEAAGRLDDIANIYYQKKNRYLSCGDNDHPSYVVYIEAVNEVYQKPKNSIQLFPEMWPCFSGSSRAASHNAHCILKEKKKHRAGQKRTSPAPCNNRQVCIS